MFERAFTSYFSKSTYKPYREYFKSEVKNGPIRIYFWILSSKKKALKAQHRPCYINDLAISWSIRRGVGLRFSRKDPTPGYL